MKSMINLPNPYQSQNSVLGIFFLCGIRDIMLDIEKIWIFGIRDKIADNIRDNISNTKTFFLLLAGIYIQIRIDWNRFPVEKRIDYD